MPEITRFSVDFENVGFPLKISGFWILVDELTDS